MDLFKTSVIVLLVANLSVLVTNAGTRSISGADNTQVTGVEASCEAAADYGDQILTYVINIEEYAAQAAGSSDDAHSAAQEAAEYASEAVIVAGEARDYAASAESEASDASYYASNCN